MSSQLWTVVGGGDKGGILVRAGKELDSAKEQARLATGSVVREVELAGERLHYALEDGSGPPSGWVSLSISGRELLVRGEKGAAPARAAARGGAAASTFQLLDGRRMPALGLGVYRSRPGKETYDAVRWALELGYRLVDTAAYYENEESVGRAIRDSGVPREELWVTTKLPGHGHGYEDAMNLCRTSLDLLGLDYLDLYLIHSPNGGRLVETWDALVELQRQGLVRSIGVSNFGVKHLEALRSRKRPLPTVNQIEMHPLVYEERKSLVEYCKQHGILVEAYGSVFSGHQDKLNDPAVARVLAGHPGKTGAQVLLRWGLQMGFQLIPKSVRQARQRENMDIFDFELSAAEMQSLGRMKGSLMEYWNPLDAPLDLGRVDLGGTA